MKTVEMHPAYVWTCDTCGRDNFERAAVYEFTPQDKADLEAEGQEAETGEWLTYPEEVACQHCGAEFQARPAGADDDSLVER